MGKDNTWRERALSSISACYMVGTPLLSISEAVITANSADMPPPDDLCKHIRSLVDALTYFRPPFGSVDAFLTRIDNRLTGINRPSDYYAKALFEAARIVADVRSHLARIIQTRHDIAIFMPPDSNDTVSDAVMHTIAPETLDGITIRVDPERMPQTLAGIAGLQATPDQITLRELVNVFNEMAFVQRELETISAEQIRDIVAQKGMRR